MIVTGRNPVFEALNSLHKKSTLFLQHNINSHEKITQIIQSAQKEKLHIKHIPRKKLDKLSKGEPHQGVAIEIDYQTQKLSKNQFINQEGLYLYIREAQYEHNIGAIARTAEIAQIAGLIIPPQQDITAVTARISMGAIFHLDIFKSSLFPTVKLAASSGYPVYGLERGGESIFNVTFQPQSLILIGGEDKPLSDSVTDKCDKLVTIPQYGKINSLNMSVAAGIAIYTYRQQYGLRIP